MDLRSIINPDAPSAVKPAQETRAHEASRSYGSPTAAAPPVLPPAPPGYLSRPAPPTELRFASATSAHDSARSPYPTGSPSSALGGGQYPFPARSPGYGAVPGPAHAYARTSPTAGVPPIQTTPHAYAHHSTQSLSPAPTSGGAYQYGTAPHPPHPIHASPTISSMTSSTPQTSQDSPTSAQSHHHHYPASYYSHPSQPATPLGPPTGYPYAATSYRPDVSQTSNQSPRDSAAPSHPTSQHSYPLTTTTIPPQTVSEVRPPEVTSTDHGRGGSDYGAQRERERSLSVSPKTMLPDPSRRHSQHDHQWNGQVTPAKRKQVHESESEHGHPPRPGMNGVKNQAAAVQSPTASSTTGRPYFDPIEGRETMAGRRVSSPAEAKLATAEIKSRELSASSAKDVKSAESPAMGERHRASTTPHSLSGRGSPVAQSAPTNASLPIILSPLGPPPSDAASSGQNATLTLKREASGAASSSVSPQPRAKKRARRDEPPIYARKAGQVVESRNSAGPRNRRQAGAGAGAGAGATSAGIVKTEAARDAKLSTADAPVPAKDGQQPAAAEDAGVALPQAQPSLPDEGPLGPWEPSITNVIPYEEMTRRVMDFLFMEVVERKDVGVGSGSAGSGVQLEIEAKLGQLIDKNTNERVRLPVLTECIFNKDHPSWRTAFRSSMTESQHRTLNQFLNKAVVSSNARPSPSTNKPRIPLQYVHTRELDRFYELPAGQLPAIPLSVRPLIHARGHRTKVRVTHDQKTGEQLAQIIKIRIADLDVYSPRTAFDWRVSVNLEMVYDGDVSGLTEVTEAGNGNKGSKRSKDRMTYRHLAYQIDLTQVTLQAEGSKMEKEHELEIEVSAQQLREQGTLAKEGQPTQYEDLVRGFVDNVRMLTRVVPL